MDKIPPKIFRFADRSLRFQFLVVIAILLIIPLLVITYDIFFASRSEEALLKERKDKLGPVIENLIAPNIRELIKPSHGGTNFNELNIEDRVSYLKKAFNQTTEPLVTSNPGVRFGLYIPETGQIFVQGFLHQYRQLTPIQELNRKKRILGEANSGLVNVAAGGQPLARLTTSLNDQTYEYLYPIYIDNQLVAVTWADQRVNPIFAQSHFFRTLIVYFTLFALMVSFIGALLIIYNLTMGVSKIKNALKMMEKDLNNPIPELPGEVGQIAYAINNMASSLAEKEKLEEELRRSEHLAALGHLVTGVAHELRNPIGVIKTTVQLMKTEFPSINKSDHIKIIEEQITRQNRVIQELLDFGRPSKHAVQSISINLLLEKVFIFTSSMLRQHSIKLVQETNDNLPATEVDGERIKQVFVNLILNSVQAMPDGGTLTIKTHYDDKWIYTEFIDTGHGISSSEMNHIFDPFYTTKEKGTGLGLSISHQIIRTHGGHINVLSKENYATTFIVQLPLSEIWDLYS